MWISDGDSQKGGEDICQWKDDASHSCRSDVVRTTWREVDVMEKSVLSDGAWKNKMGVKDVSSFSYHGQPGSQQGMSDCDDMTDSDDEGLAYCVADVLHVRAAVECAWRAVQVKQAAYDAAVKVTDSVSSHALIARTQQAAQTRALAELDIAKEAYGVTLEDERLHTH
jgi:hypothetical protein